MFTMAVRRMPTSPTRSAALCTRLLAQSFAEFVRPVASERSEDVPASSPRGIRCGTLKVLLTASDCRCLAAYGSWPAAEHVYANGLASQDRSGCAAASVHPPRLTMSTHRGGAYADPPR